MLTTTQSQRVKCGEVYTWDFNGELFAVECHLCEERPFCTLSEYAEHMEIWHSTWYDDKGQQEYEELVQEVIDEIEAEVHDELENDSGYDVNENAYSINELKLYNNANEVTNTKTNEHFQPFEQVLITSADHDLITTTSKYSIDVLPAAEICTNSQSSHACTEITSNSHANNEQIRHHIQDPTTLNAKSQILYGLNEPMPSDRKLTSTDIGHLVDLYKEHPRLWNQSHAEFSETHLIRKSWQNITEKWNTLCQKNFRVTDVRIRISTLCQRYIKERQRLENKGQFDECSKFVHFEKLKFLDEQQTIQNRRKFFEQQNAKLIEVYKHYPLLWHCAHKPMQCTKQRMEAIRSISTALNLCGIHLSSNAVIRRIKSLRKCYRIEKIRYLHSQVEQSKFDMQFVHFKEMEFLDKHINPFVCNECGKIFEHLVHYRDHVQKKNHGELPEMDEENISLYTDDYSNDDKDEWNWEEEMMVVKKEQSKDIENDGDDSEVKNSIEDALIVDVNGEVEKENEELIMKSNINPMAREVLQNQNISLATVQPADSSTSVITTPDISNTSEELIVKVACGNYSYDLKLNASENMETDDCDDDSGTDEEKYTQSECFARLTLQQTQLLIKIYKNYPSLWDPNHLDYHSRLERRVAWRALTQNLNKALKVRYSWKTLHRKITDFVKYYRREKHRLETNEESYTKWCFYDDFSFLDDVLNITDELQKSLQLRDNNLKIIEVYKNHPQLWNTDHPEYSKRSHRQKHIDSLNTQLQEANIHITSERLRNRLIEFRFNYRTIKQKRLEAEERNETPTIKYDFYEALKFLDPHIAPFQCLSCDVLFKRYSDYVLHKRKTHEQLTNTASATESLNHSRNKSTLDNVCHICGIKFTLRSNLICHLRRHLNERTHACTLCSKTFFTKNSLNVHIRSHTKEQPYQCDKCGRGFVNASKLNQHLKRHRNERNYACEHCEKKFFTAFERDRHERVHLQIREKICPICGKDFIKGSAYYTHMHLHRSEKRYKCDVCNEKFAQYSGLYKHRKRHHSSK